MGTVIAYGVFLLVCRFCLIAGVARLVKRDISRQYKGKDKLLAALPYFLITLGLIKIMGNPEFISKFDDLYAPLFFIFSGIYLAFELRIRRLELDKKE